MVPELIILALLIGWIIGGKFSRLADLQIKHGWIIFFAVVIYAIGLRMAYLPFMSHHRWIFGALHLSSIAAYIFLMISNAKLPGTKLITIGLMLNAIAIMANGGFMPASSAALGKVYGHKYVMQTRNAPHFRSSIMDSETKLGALCDIIPLKLPTRVSSGVYSIGDMWMSAGIFLAVILIMRTPLQQERVAPTEAEIDAV